MTPQAQAPRHNRWLSFDLALTTTSFSVGFMYLLVLLPSYFNTGSLPNYASSLLIPAIVCTVGGVAMFFVSLATLDKNDTSEISVGVAVAWTLLLSPLLNALPNVTHSLPDNDMTYASLNIFAASIINTFLTWPTAAIVTMIGGVLYQPWSQRRMSKLEPISAEID